MSFYYLKNINFKNQTLRAAPNNVRPLIYYNADYKNLSQDDFIKEVLYNIFEGSFIVNNKKYNYLNDIINNLNLVYDSKKQEEHKNALLNALKNREVVSL